MLRGSKFSHIMGQHILSAGEVLVSEVGIDSITASFDLVDLKLAAGNAGKDLELLECLGCLELK